ncbi:chemotaxis protein CheA [Leisingera aquimarina]|uniref:chemotaxis protein CheA n=1 Tax=Leisingera aquimarina TaxID=476529 RepID=UPI00040F8018|nr:chemotaxis protein CheA [Leisingera aquimarina]
MSGSIQDTFFEECEELLEATDEGLTAIEGGDHDPETVNAIFRAVHSIKGGAGAFGLDDLVAFAHRFETVFDEVRAGRMELDGKLIQLLLRSSDQLSALVEVARDGGEIDEAHNDTLLAALDEYIPEEEEDLTFEPMGLGAPAPVADLGIVPEAPAEPQEETYRIRFQPLKEMYGTGNEPFFLFQALKDMGDLTVKLDENELPGFDAMDMSESYLAWDITLVTKDSRSMVEAVFEFVEGLCELSIDGEGDAEAEANALAALDAMFSTPDAPPAPPAADAAEGEAPAVPFEPPVPAPEPEAKPAPAEEKASAPKAESGKQEQRGGPKPTLRVELERVDRLINAVGELIINHSMLAQQIANLDVSDTRDVETELEGFKNLARDIQEGVMAIRAQPVKPLFQRMARIVREASAATGKTCKLVNVGENTEVDKTVIERLSDPLTHILRNAVDHGVEKPEDREAAGKSKVGEIQLSASHRSGSVCIEIKDDGAGVNRPRVKQIAIEKGLIPENAELTDGEIDNLLFAPGFSTAKEVSNLSGRGVGMDVVKNAVTGLGGRINISSTPGKGSTFTIILPLTLAVMDGMVVSVADQTMVVPITSIVETMRGSDDMINSLGADGTLLSIRGNFVPICDVAGSLGLYRESDQQAGVYLLVETETGQRCALAVDDIHDQRQVVIKSLDGVCGEIAGVAAATILGDGKIAMILDPESIIAASPTAAAFDTERRMSNAS